VTRPRAVNQAPPPIEFVGVVTSRKSSVITAQVAAPLVKFNVHAGQLVKAGELIAKLDETELQTRLAAAQANEKAARMEAGALGASASAAHQTVINETRLGNYGASSRTAINNARAELARIQATGAAAAARAMTARAEREQAEKNLAKCEIYSPLDGIITNIKAAVGQSPTIGTPLARVFDPADLIIRFSVPREQHDAVKLGQRVELVPEGGGQKVVATVTNVSGAQEPPINFTVVEADIDDAKLARSELTVASVGRVRIADARGAKR
jgi:RND family efflux transporter MFP subunit